MAQILCGRRAPSKHADAAARCKKVTLLSPGMEKGQRRSAKARLAPICTTTEYDPRHIGPAPPSPSYPQASINPNQAIITMASQTRTPKLGAARNKKE